jgi:hypothetical protein
MNAPEKPQIVSRDARNDWDWYRVTPREMLLDTRYSRLNAEALGVLTKLTWLAWELGSITSDLDDLALLTRFSGAELSRALPQLTKQGLLGTLEDGSLWVPDAELHLRQLIREAEERSERSRKAGKASAAARQGRNDEGDIPF